MRKKPIRSTTGFVYYNMYMLLQLYSMFSECNAAQVMAFSQPEITFGRSLCPGEDLSHEGAATDFALRVAMRMHADRFF